MGRPGEAPIRWESIDMRMSDGKALRRAPQMGRHCDAHRRGEGVWEPDSMNVHDAFDMGKHCGVRRRWEGLGTRVPDGKALHGAVQMGRPGHPDVRWEGVALRSAHRRAIRIAE